MPTKTFMGTPQGPRELGRIWTGNGYNRPQELKKVWIGTNQGPKLIFGDLFSEAVFWLDASQERGFGNEAPFYTNQINGAQYAIQEPWLGLGGGSWSWDFGQMNDYWNAGDSSIPALRPVSFNTQFRYLDAGTPPTPNRGRPGRSGTIRLPQESRDATLMIVGWVDPDRPVNAGPNFYNMSFFNAAGVYEQGNDYYRYTGATIAEMSWGSSTPGKNNMWDTGFWEAFRRLSICTMYTRDNKVVYRLRTRTTPTRYGQEWPGVGTREIVQDRTEQQNIRDVRIFDLNGGGVMAFKGELYETLVFDRGLQNGEIEELENHFLNEKYPNLI